MRIISSENKQDVDTKKYKHPLEQILTDTRKNHRFGYATEFVFAAGDASMANIKNQFETK